MAWTLYFLPEETRISAISHVLKWAVAKKPKRIKPHWWLTNPYIVPVCSFQHVLCVLPERQLTLKKRYQPFNNLFPLFLIRTCSKACGLLPTEENASLTYITQSRWSKDEVPHDTEALTTVRVLKESIIWAKSGYVGTFNKSTVVKRLWARHQDHYF